MKRLVLIALVTGACATTGASGEGDRDLPSSGVGPFRKLDIDEVKGIAPFVLDDEKAGYREPAALQEGEVTLLFAVGAKDGRDVIFRTRALDGRTFHGTSGHFGAKARVVLEPDAAPSWEKGALSGPALVRAPSGELLLYYAAGDAAGGGIGVARSTDGFTFTKDAANPILKREAAWETSEVRAPSVVRLPSGRFRMFYAAGNAIGEADSDDGIHFRRASDRPVLEPAAPAAPGSLLPNEKPPFDTASVADPCASFRTTPGGRLQVRVLYTGRDPAGASTIGFAARYGEDGPLVRQSVAVYAVGQTEVAPAFVERPEGSYLYVEQERRDGTRTYRAIAGAFAPGNIKLPTPGDFPESP
jgi:hypothetical protein